MAAPVVKQFQVPKDFPSVLKAFTREILRSQPTDVYQFGADYFNEILAQLAQAQQEAATSHRLSVEELEHILRTLFQEADTDGSNTLSLAEFKGLMNRADLGLSKKELRALLAEADVNSDGEIDYAEFVPLATELVQALYAREEMAQAQKQEEVDALQMATQTLLHGMSREELEFLIREVFQKADTDGSGSLNFEEFRKCINDAELGLTRREINSLLLKADVSGDGEISYDEFYPLCYDLLLEIMQDEIMKSKSPTDLETFFLDTFAAADTDRSGTLPTSTIRDVIRSVDMGFTRLQIHSIMAEAPEDEDGYVDYAAFAPIVASLAYKLVSPEGQQQRLDAVAQIQSAASVHGYDAPTVSSILYEACEARDPTRSGFLPRAALREALGDNSLGLTQKEISAMMAAAEFDYNNNAEYAPLIDYSYKLLSHIAREEQIYGA